MEITCDYCNKKYNYTGGIVHFNRSKKHYCSIECLSKSNIIHGLAKKIDGKQDKRYTIMINAKKRAKIKGIEFSLELKDMPYIPEYCPILGIKIEPNKYAGPKDCSPSLDRINPNFGYVKGNVRIISNRSNRIKSDATLEELELILQDAKNIQDNNK